jgi:pimeloyl-ACP methyl ester carboxylesterase/DNA-binding CsgD family transcriptional regulator
MEYLSQRIRFCTARDGVRIGYALTGQGPPLVKAANWLSHLEFDGSSPVWRHWLTELSRHHTLIRYDERGNGLSDRDVDDLSFEAWVSDLEAVVEARGIDRFPLLGISQGAAVAVAYAARHPERVTRLILYGGYVRGWNHRQVTAQQAEEAQTLIHLMKLGWGSNNPAFRQVFASLMMPDATQEQMRWFTDLQHATTSADIAVRLRHAAYDINVADLARQVTAPTLVLHARGDVAVPAREGMIAAELIPGAEFVPLNSRNHILIEDEPAWPHFLSELRAFLGSEQTTSPRPQLQSVFADLTEREREVLEFVAQGLDNADLAVRLSLSPKTVRNHVSSIFDKLNVHSRAQVIVRARDAGFGKQTSTMSS